MKLNSTGQADVGLSFRLFASLFLAAGWEFVMASRQPSVGCVD